MIEHDYIKYEYFKDNHTEILSKAKIKSVRLLIQPYTYVYTY